MGQMLRVVCMCARVCVRVKDFNEFPNWMEGADMAQCDPALQPDSSVIYPKSDSHGDAFRFSGTMGQLFCISQIRWKPDRKMY